MDYYRRPGFLSWMPPVIKNLIIINVIMLIATYLMGDTMYERFALFYYQSPFFKPVQIVTHMFMHGGFFHLFFNMYALVIFGVILEQVWGSKRFLTYYLVTGLGAAALHMLTLHIQVITASDPGIIDSIMRTPTVGASGAVYGVLLAYGMSYPDNRITLLFPPVTLKAKWFVIIFGGIELLLGLSNSGSNIAHFAHLGGMLFGYLLLLYWRKKKNIRY